jgi:hypothetical protein
MRNENIYEMDLGRNEMGWSGWNEIQMKETEGGMKYK